MSLRTFLRTYREEIDRRIREKAAVAPAHFNERLRRAWILDTPSLSDWARSLGVKL